MSKLITPKQADKIQLMESRSHYLKALRFDKHNESARHEKKYNAYLKSLGITRLQAEKVAWLAVMAWNNDKELTDIII